MSGATWQHIVNVWLLLVVLWLEHRISKLEKR